MLIKQCTSTASWRNRCCKLYILKPNVWVYNKIANISVGDSVQYTLRASYCHH